MSIQELEDAAAESKTEGTSASQISTTPSEILPHASATTTEDYPKRPLSSKKASCGVCRSKLSQYKCSICYLPYCSLSCSTAHKIEHPILSVTASPLPKVERESGPIPKVDASVPRNMDPFASLDESKDLQSLFKLYPNLSNVLEKIYQATLPPVGTAHHPAASGRPGRFKRERPWTSDVGMQKGVKALHAAKRSGNQDGESVRAYTRLVMNLVEANSDLNAADQIQKELAEQDANLIKSLLDGGM